MAFSFLQEIRPTQAVAILFGLWLGIMLVRRRINNLLVRLLSLLLLTVLVISTWRLSVYWQILPLWVAALAGCFAAWKPPATRLPVRWMGMLVICGAAGSAAGLAILPLFSLPAPTGHYRIGTRVVHLTDWTQSDNSFPSHHRELMVQVWYPATPSGGRLAAYRRWRETSWLSSYDAVLKTHSYEDAPMAANGAPFPIVLFNPAWEGDRTQNTFQAEDLASHGFVVIAIDHTHNSMPVAFPDGQILFSTEPRSVSDLSGETFAQQMTFADAEMNREVRDDEFVLSAFAAFHARHGASAPWTGKLDFAHIGALGHSFGGAVSIALCERDPRVKSAINMDGWIFGALQPEDPHKPLMVMYDSGWPFNQQAVQQERASSDPGDVLDVFDLDELTRLLPQSGGYILGFPGTGHMNFTDRALYSPFHHLTDCGPANPMMVHRIINAYTTAFFAETLRGEHEELLHRASPLPGSYVEAWSSGALDAKRRGVSRASSLGES
jgi:predicted dienelactone hydrolase